MNSTVTWNKLTWWFWLKEWVLIQILVSERKKSVLPRKLVKNHPPLTPRCYSVPHKTFLKHSGVISGSQLTFEEHFQMILNKKIKLPPELSSTKLLIAAHLYYDDVIYANWQKQSCRGVLWKGVLRNLTKFAGKHLCQSLFFKQNG